MVNAAQVLEVEEVQRGRGLRVAGHGRLWPNRLWPIVVLTDFGQTDFGQFGCFSVLAKFSGVVVVLLCCFVVFLFCVVVLCCCYVLLFCVVVLCCVVVFVVVVCCCCLLFCVVVVCCCLLLYPTPKNPNPEPCLGRGPALRGPTCSGFGVVVCGCCGVFGEGWCGRADFGQSNFGQSIFGHWPMLAASGPPGASHDNPRTPNVHI